MSDDDEEILTNSSGEPKEEDFNWVNKENRQAAKLKEYYLKYPFETWEKIVRDNFDLENYDKQTIYQETVNKVLEKEIYKNENFIGEGGGMNIFEKFLKALNVDIKEIEKNIKIDLKCVKPDFCVVGMKREDFLLLIKNRKYMFHYDKAYISLSEAIGKINIIGEIKPEKIDQNQKLRYFNFCNYMNKKFKESQESKKSQESKESPKCPNDYYLTQYIIDVSYQKFWYKKFYQKSPCIIGYIPKLYSREYIKVYHKLLLDAKNNNNINKEKGKECIIRNEILANKNRDEQIKVRKEETKIGNIKENDIENIKKINFENMNKEELLKSKRELEDNIIKMKREYEDEEQDMEIKIRLQKRENEDILLNKKRKIEDGENTLIKIEQALEKKKKAEKENKI